MILPAPIARRENGSVFLDTKFVEGMRLHQRLWDGPVACVLWDRPAEIPFGAEYAVDDLGFELQVLEQGTTISPDHLADSSVVGASADMSEALQLASMCHASGAGLVMNVEYTLKTRLKIAMLDRRRHIVRKGRSVVWNLFEERRRRAALRAADAVQFNGYPAQMAYGAICRDGLLYLDGRMHASMMATPDEIAARAERLASGAPLRIVHSGRLASMKGAQDLLPVARALRDHGANFRLDIFGAGELEDEIRSGIIQSGLDRQVHLHAPVAFETELVPHLRKEADLFLSCHRQADPSCSYLESMGCGLPVVGYDNEMWAAILRASDAGWITPVGKTDAIAATLARLSRDPNSVSGKASKALQFARAHDFDSEFALRMQHYAKYARN